MKRVLLVFMLVALLAGCATDGSAPPIVQDEKVQDALITITARNLAFFVGRNNPEILDPAIAFCSAFEGEGVNLQPLIAQGITYLDAEVKGYPMAQKDLETLLGIFDIPILNAGTALTPRQVAMVRVAAAAMREGFQFAKDNPKGA